MGGKPEIFYHNCISLSKKMITSISIGISFGRNLRYILLLNFEPTKKYRVNLLFL